MERLKELLKKIDRKGYKAYKTLTGSYEFPRFTLFIDHVQGDPFAIPSKIRMVVNQNMARFPKEHLATKIRRIALEDYVTRGVAKAIFKHAKGHRGTGKSGLISVQSCGQEVLERTSVKFDEGALEARLRLGLPAYGRTISAMDAHAMFFEEIPKIALDSLFYSRYDPLDLNKHLDLADDQQALRQQLKSLKLVSFVPDGAHLPRESGISDKPLAPEKTVVFTSPPSLREEVRLPHRKKIAGMGIPEGVTLIVGGGYHGKTTLLKAIEKGVYDHIPGDGRELVVTREDAVKIRAEDGRRVEKVNISSFITNLPRMKDTTAFSTEDASGSTSQAANIIEALEVGTSLLLIDEDTSATNFMIRDERMQELVAKEKEPITPFIDKARLLYEEIGTSSVIVLGGSGDYLDVANRVIMMDEYLPREVTTEAREIVKKHTTRRMFEGGENFGNVTPRIPAPASFEPRRGGKPKVKGKGVSIIEFGRSTIDLSLVEQLQDPNQTEAIGSIILFALNKKIVDAKRSFKEVIKEVLREIEENGLEILSPTRGHPGELALPRKYEIAAAINRLRTLKAKQ